MRSPHPALSRRSSPRAWPATALALCVAAACDRAAEPAAALPTQAAATPSSFERRGAPGPWWREGGTDAAFDAESRTCLAQSREARRRAPEDARADAAYRAFLGCMEWSGWRRGARPPGAALIAPGR